MICEVELTVVSNCTELNSTSDPGVVPFFAWKLVPVIVMVRSPLPIRTNGGDTAVMVGHG